MAINGIDLGNGGFSSLKKIGKSEKYKHVEIIKVVGTKAKTIYNANISGIAWNKLFEDEREAAKAVDIKLIEKGREPINVLKRLKK